MAVGEELDLVGPHQRRVAVPARPAEPQQLLAQRGQVVRGTAPTCRPGRARVRDEGDWVATPVGQRPVWQRWDWMQPMASIASRATFTMSQPSAMAVRPRLARPRRPGADEHDVVVQALLGERPVDPGEAPQERQRDVVAEHQRRRAGAALAAVDGDEVGPGAGGRPSARRARSQKSLLPHRRLDAHRQPGRLGERLDELDHRVDVAERRVAVRALAVDAHGDAADRGDLSG